MTECNPITNPITNWIANTREQNWSLELVRVDTGGIKATKAATLWSSTYAGAERKADAVYYALDAIEAVLGIHQPYHDEMGTEVCISDNHSWPCDTVMLVEKSLKEVTDEG